MNDNDTKDDTLKSMKLFQGCKHRNIDNEQTIDKTNHNISDIHNMNISEYINVRSNSGKWYTAKIIDNTKNNIKLKINGKYFQIRKKSIKFVTDIC